MKSEDNHDDYMVKEQESETKSIIAKVEDEYLLSNQNIIVEDPETSKDEKSAYDNDFEVSPSSTTLVEVAVVESAVETNTENSSALGAGRYCHSPLSVTS